MPERRSPSDTTWQTRPRRRAIEASLRRRPDIDLDGLSEVLRRLGFEADRPTLLADLDALGYDVDEPSAAPPAPAPVDRGDPTDDPPGDPADDPADDPAASEPPARSGGPSFLPPARPAVRPPASPPPARLLAVPSEDPVPVSGSVLVLPVEVDAFADGSTSLSDAVVPEGLGEEEAPAPRRLRALLPLVSLVLLVVLVVATALALPPDDAPEELSGPATAPAADDDEGGGGSEDAPPPPDRRDPELADPATLDVEVPFEGDAAELPPVEGLEPWVTEGADWYVRSGTARAGMTDAPRGVATLRVPTPDLRAEVTLPEGTSGTGLAFRVQNETTYLAWVVAPRFFTANLYRVTAGRARLVLNSGLTAVPPGVRVGVHVVDRIVELLIDGEVVATFDDVWTPDATGVGLVAMEPAEAPVFDDLRVRYEQE